jgi:hypothetical protein
MAYTGDKWLEIFRQWEQSGLTRAEYCRMKKLAVSTFDYWRQKTRNKSTGQSDLVKVSLGTRHNREPALTLLLPGGYQIEVPSGYQSENLKQLITDIQEIQ